MNKSSPGVSILKSIWRANSDGHWNIHEMKGITLKPRPGFEPDFFQFESRMELMTHRPATRSMYELLTSFGPTDFLIKQSVVPVIALVNGENSIRCIGTAFVIACTGYVVTACHVLLDPQDRNYGTVKRRGNNLIFMEDLTMGVLIPLSPASGRRGFIFSPFEQSWYWGDWKESPLVHESETFDILTDIAVCKIPQMPDGSAHQPFCLSLKPFIKGEMAYALGYAEMDDIPLVIRNGRTALPDVDLPLYVSIGEVMEVFPDNHIKKHVPTPGPCFDFQARVPGKMSGGPIFGANGLVVRGVVSRSFSGEKHAYGAMLGPIVHLPLGERSLKTMIETGNEGIPNIQGEGL